MNQRVVEAINRQINSELSASYSYLAMSAWCERQKFVGAARWLRLQSQEEQMHAMKLLDFLLNDPAASLATGTTRGVPANADVAEEIKSSLEPDDQLATDYLISLQGEDLPRSLLYPPGWSAVFDFLDALAVEVEFGRVSPADAAAQFIEQAEGAIAG